MKTIVTGILAHVDAGKTTLTEALLYAGGATRTLGRVDHGDSFLDNDLLERRRGITIYSKQARMKVGDTEIVIVDTPGHTDFGAEAERACQVLDAAILVISGSDGVQPHAETLWNLLDRYKVPTFVFVNKMDLEGADHTRVMDELQARLGDGFVNFQAQHDEPFWEQLAMLSEPAMEQFLELGHVGDDELKRMISERALFPCFFGSALNMGGTDDLLAGLAAYAQQPDWNTELGALVYKITHDKHGERLTWMKVTGGTLHTKDLLRGGSNPQAEGDNGPSAADAVNGWHPGPNSYIKSAFGGVTTAQHQQQDAPWQEKINQIRLYSGERFDVVDQVSAGQVCAVTGLSHTYAGEGLGVQAEAPAPLLMPVLSYGIRAEGVDSHKLLEYLRLIEDEKPELGVAASDENREISLQLMGAIQLEVLQETLRERFGVEARFSTGSVIYRETITRPFSCGGHFEPLRHYAEVRLEMEPLPKGSGIMAGSTCSVDMLDLNWQRLVVTHLLERDHPGTLTGSPITDVRLTLVNGRAHAKHTNGGDFRQATYRAVRQGLMQAREAGAVTLLEPWYDYRLEVPADAIGRAMADIQKMGGSFEPPEHSGSMSVLQGRVPVAEVGDYAVEVGAYTHGTGRFSCVVAGYAPCHDQEQTIAESGYDPLADVTNPTYSVFCSHGAGYNVPWDQVMENLHTS